MRTAVSRFVAAAAVVTAAGLPLVAGPAHAATALLKSVSPIAADHAVAPVTFSGSGDVTAAASFVDVVIPAGPVANSSTSGCEAADFGGFTVGHIAVIQRGTCTFRVKALNAQAAGAAAVVLFNEGQAGRTDLFASSLAGPGVTIPVVMTTYGVAELLNGLAGNVLRVATTDEPGLELCATPPAPGTPIGGRTVVVAQPGELTVGTEGPDVIYGTEGPDRILGLGGDDVIFGFGGDDQIAGEGGDDVICGGPGADWISGGAGDDRLAGDEGDDRLAGEEGDDELVGGPGLNRLVGGRGSDTCSPFGSPSSQAALCEVVRPAT